MYQALYRKWRPRTFDDVVGQDHITETLKRQVASGRLSHAYLTPTSLPAPGAPARPPAPRFCPGR